MLKRTWWQCERKTLDKLTTIKKKDFNFYSKAPWTIKRVAARFISLQLTYAAPAASTVVAPSPVYLHRRQRRRIVEDERVVLPLLPIRQCLLLHLEPLPLPVF